MNGGSVNNSVCVSYLVIDMPWDLLAHLIKIDNRVHFNNAGLRK